MEKLIKLNSKSIIVLYVLVDIICVGTGMGVPIFCILLGFPLGWYITKRISVSRKSSYMLYRQVLKWSFLASAFTFLQMIFIWGIWAGMILALFNPSFDFRNFGHPFILYDPKVSFIGWLILMLFISPFLQLLTTIFASFVTLVRKDAK